MTQKCQEKMKRLKVEKEEQDQLVNQVVVYIT